MARILGIESTCDETAAAVVADGCTVLSNIVASQAHLHAIYRGVVPEIASRAHIENILPVLRESLQQANIALADIDAISIAHRPGLIGSLLIGVTAAKTLAWSMRKPLIGVDHVHAHLYSVMLADDSPAPKFPAVGLVVSGGHTALYAMESFSDVRLIGSTIDDAVGEAYDKVSAILGLGYPGGPIITARLQWRPGVNPLATSGQTADSSGLKPLITSGVPQKAAGGHRPPKLTDRERPTFRRFKSACTPSVPAPLKIKRALQNHPLGS
jgi:N6-L-threonylcarbamoyladenine synthase